MGAICGLVDIGGTLSRGHVRRALDALVGSAVHRGPDGVSSHVDTGAGLAHLALHTTPEAKLERQPCTARNSSVLLVADVRLDNREELIRHLELGERRPDDAELVLAAYLRWGQDSPQHLLGDFSFVVWDANCRTMFAAVDPLGVRPLYFGQDGQRIAFASEAAQLLELPGHSNDLDELTIAAFLSGELHLPEHRTFYRNVRALSGGFTLTATAQGTELTRYWQPRLRRTLIYRDRREYGEHLRELLRRAVDARLRTCQEAVGITMSGGLDSTSVAAFAQRSAARRQEGTRLVVSSMLFEQLTDCDESSYIRTMEKEHDLEVIPVDAEANWFLGDSEAYLPRLDTPLVGWESCFREMFRHLGERGARIVLTGVGGDDVLGGGLHIDRSWRPFHWHELQISIQEARSRGRPVARELTRQWIAPLFPDPFDRFLRWITRRPRRSAIPRWIHPRLVERSGLESWLRHEESSRRRRRFRRGMPYGADFLTRHPGTLWIDRTAARWGMEPRHPLLDQRIVEFALSIPPRELLDGQPKSLLRLAAGELLPETVRHRSDRSNLGPFLDWSLRVKERERVEGLFRGSRAAALKLIDADRCIEAFHAYCSGQATEQNRSVWYAICLERWLRRLEEH